jgi:hypothetical protein
VLLDRTKIKRAVMRYVRFVLSCMTRGTWKRRNLAQENEHGEAASYFTSQYRGMNRGGIRVAHLMLILVPISMTLYGAVRIIHAVAYTQRQARQSNCEGSLFFIGAHLADYRDKHGQFPPICSVDSMGKPMHSWRAILYAEIEPNFRQAYDFNEPWDSPKNIRVAEHPPRFFYCGNNQGEPARYTNFVAIVDRERGNLGHIAPRGQFPTKDVRLAQTENRGLILIEDPDSDIRWTEPRDLTIEELESIGRGEDPAGIAVLLEDRRVYRLSREEIIHFIGQKKER